MFFFILVTNINLYIDYIRIYVHMTWVFYLLTYLLYITFLVNLGNDWKFDFFQIKIHLCQVSQLLLNSTACLYLTLYIFFRNQVYICSLRKLNCILGNELNELKRFTSWTSIKKEAKFWNNILFVAISICSQ